MEENFFGGKQWGVGFLRLIQNIFVSFINKQICSHYEGAPKKK